MICGAFSFNGKINLQVVQGWQTAAGYVDMLQQTSLLTEGPRLCSNDWIFQQDNTAIHNACLTKRLSCMLSWFKSHWEHLGVDGKGSLKNGQKKKSVPDRGWPSWSHLDHMEQHYHQPSGNTCIKHAEMSVWSDQQEGRNFTLLSHFWQFEFYYRVFLYLWSADLSLFECLNKLPIFSFLAFAPASS